MILTLFFIVCVVIIFFFQRGGLHRIPKDGFILITGVSSGIGQFLAQRLPQQGYHVIGTVRTLDDLNNIKKECNSLNLSLILMDVTSEDSVMKGFKEVEKIVGNNGIYALVNNAGTYTYGALEHVSVEEFNNVFAVNLLGTVRVTKTFLPLLRKCSKGRAQIYNITSPAGWTGRRLLCSYSCSKFAIEGLSDCLRKELMHQRISVIKVAPVMVKSKMVSNIASIASQYYEKCRENNSPYVSLALEAKHVFTAASTFSSPVDELFDGILQALCSTTPPSIIFTKKSFKLWLYAKLPNYFSDKLVF